MGRYTCLLNSHAQMYQLTNNRRIMLFGRRRCYCNHRRTGWGTAVMRYSADIQGLARGLTPTPPHTHPHPTHTPTPPFPTPSPHSTRTSTYYHGCPPALMLYVVEQIPVIHYCNTFGYTAWPDQVGRVVPPNHPAALRMGMQMGFDSPEQHMRNDTMHLGSCLWVSFAASMQNCCEEK